MSEMPYFRKHTWTVDEVADFFRVSRSTIYRWLEEREDFPRPFLVRHTRRWKAEEMVRYWKENLR